MGKFIKDELIEKTEEEKQEELKKEQEKKQKVINTLEKRKEKRILIFFGILTCCVPIILPTLTAFFKQDSMDNYKMTMQNAKKIKTVDGYMLINNNQSSSVVEKIEFYNVRKNSNKISFAYEPNTKIDNLKSLNLYVEIYNKNKEIIYRELFNPVDTIEKGKIKRYSKSLNAYTFNNAYYIKINRIDKPSDNNEVLTCSYNLKKDNYTLDYEIYYTFNDNFLTKYEVSKNINGNINDNNVNVVNLNKEFKEVNEEVEATFNNNQLHYIVDLIHEYTKFTPLYPYGSTKDQITKTGISNNWSCK